MSSMRLNCAAVAANTLPVTPAATDLLSTLESLVDRPPALTRREAIKAVSVAAAVAAGATSIGSLEVLDAPHVGTRARSAWLRAGRHHALLDPGAFCGSPSLRVSQGGVWSALLTGATFPGLGLPAGMELTVSGTGTRSRLRIQHELGGFDAEVPLAEWLAGAAAATAGVDLSGLSCAVGTGGAVRLHGRAVASIAPDWSLRFEGSGIAEYADGTATLVADVVTLGLAAAESPSLFSRRISRRALLTMERGTNLWAIEAPTGAHSGALHFGEKTFDTYSVEAAETWNGIAYAASVATGNGTPGAAWIPAGVPEGTELPLRNVRFARLHAGEPSAYVNADFGGSRTWLRGAQRALLVGPATWAPPFEATAGAGKMSVSCEPALFAVSAPLVGMIAEPFVLPPEAKRTVKLAGTAAALGVGAASVSAIDIGPIPLPTATSIKVLRTADLLSLRFVLFNLSLVSGDTGQLLRRTNINKTSYLAVYFPPQHVLERAYMYGKEITPSPPFRAYLADETRLAFQIPSTIADAGIPYTIEGLLDWSDYTHYVVPAARNLVDGIDLKDQMRQPVAGSVLIDTAPETSLELPWGLYLSPSPNEWWSHSDAVKTANGRSELWHTRLRGEPIVWGGVQAAAAGPPDPGDITVPPTPVSLGERRATLRAVWARHYDVALAATGVPVAPTANLFRNSFTSSTSMSTAQPNDIAGLKNRWSVVDLSGRFHDEPIKVDRLLMTSLGAWLDSKGLWDIDALKADGLPITGDLMEWQHRTTMGRDQYVKVVLSGRLFPFGHKAAFLAITERRVHATKGMAYLSQKFFILVREPSLTYDQEDIHIRRRFPFSRVDIKTKMTPPITIGKISSFSVEEVGWIVDVDTDKKFSFAIEATDWDGAVHKFQMPLIWVVGTVASADPVMSNEIARIRLLACSAAVRDEYVQFSGANVAYAKRSSGDTTGERARIMPTNWMVFQAQTWAPSTLGETRFYPLLYRANVQLDAIEELTNQSAGTTIRIADIYRDNGYAVPNAQGKVFAEITEAPSIGFPAELSGALATPIPEFTGISAAKGTFGGSIDDVGSGQFAPADFFDAVNAKLIGGITLKDVLSAVLGIDLMPEFAKVVDGDALVIQYDWSTPVDREYTVFVPGGDCRLILHSEVRKSLADAGAAMTYYTRGELTDFELNLVKGVFEAVTLKFSTLIFESRDGNSPTVSPKIADVKFGGDLKYLAELAKYLGALSGADAAASLATGSEAALARAQETVLDAGPLKVDIDASGILVSLTIGIPDLSIGVFSLKNMSFYAGLRLPFTGEPVELDFAFCSRQSPFELMVMGFGGGGYFLMTFDPKGMKALEISLEFGAGTSLNIGVASGSIELKGGLSIRYERGVGLTFIVFIRLHGELDVLGLIRISLTFYLELKYETIEKTPEDGDKLTGTATLTIEIEIIFFTIPVELSVTKELAGKDPRFADLMPEQADWDEYCVAFAPAKLGA